MGSLTASRLEQMCQTPNCLLPPPSSIIHGSAPAPEQTLYRMDVMHSAAHYQIKTKKHEKVEMERLRITDKRNNVCGSAVIRVP